MSEFDDVPAMDESIRLYEKFKHNLEKQDAFTVAITFGPKMCEWQFEQCQAKIKELETALECKEHQLDLVNKYAYELSEKLKAAEDVIRFYADKISWMTVTIEDENRLFSIMKKFDVEYFHDDNRDSYAGKRAREYLKSVEEKDCNKSNILDKP